MNSENTLPKSHQDSKVKKTKSSLLSKSELVVSTPKSMNGEPELLLTLLISQTPTAPLTNSKLSGTEEEEISVDSTEN